MPKITTFLMFNDRAVEAMEYYVSIFPNSRIIERTQLGEHVAGGTFELDGQEFAVHNGGPYFNFSEGISLLVHCKDQKEIDYYWEKLMAGGGEESMCGWLKDRFGVSWQIVPDVLFELLGDPDPERAQRAMDAMLKMRKLDIAALRKAADGVAA